MGFLDKLLGRKERDANVPEPATMPATDADDHPQGEEQAADAAGEHDHGQDHDH
jgi:hypothetical protein